MHLSHPTGKHMSKPKNLAVGPHINTGVAQFGQRHNGIGTNSRP